MTFLQRLSGLAKSIITNEVGVKISRSRIHYKNYSYPFSIVAFESDNQLGYFDHHSYQIAINKRLMYTAKQDVIKNILRHEIAHLISFLEYGRSISHHGIEYKEICKKFGWGKDVYLSQTNIELQNEKIEGDIISEKVISKVKKLLQLASSDNQHEAELATIKANELLISHNISKLHIKAEQEDTVYVNRVIQGKRILAKHRAIHRILETFLVRPIFSTSSGNFYLEVTGDKVNVELANYVALFLDQQLDRLWLDTRKNYQNIKGPTAKNSFMNGVANGYVSKIKTFQNKSSNSKDIIKIEKDLEKKISMIYKRLRSTGQSSTKSCNLSSALGEAAGKNLSIRPAIKNQQSNKYFIE